MYDFDFNFNHLNLSLIYEAIFKTYKIIIKILSVNGYPKLIIKMFYYNFFLLLNLQYDLFIKVLQFHQYADDVILHRTVKYLFSINIFNITIHLILIMNVRTNIQNLQSINYIIIFYYPLNFKILYLIIYHNELKILVILLFTELIFFYDN